MAKAVKGKPFITTVEPELVLSQVSSPETKTISPIFTYLLLVHVSGINLLEKSGEKKWGDLNEYKQYKKETPRSIDNFYNVLSKKLPFDLKDKLSNSKTI